MSDQSNEVALWIMAQGFATGHGDTVTDMLEEYKAQVSAWQPIESAPRDGTEILIAGDGFVEAAYWSKCPSSVGGDGEFPWVTLDHTNQVNGRREGRHGPTYWQPLPEPPR